nr:LysR family transcriptional regulator [Stutzerimonas stutzeri]
MNLHALRIFAKVAETKSVTQTADVLSLTQPAVTAQLRSIEREIGFRLFQTKRPGDYPDGDGEDPVSICPASIRGGKEVEYQITLLQNGKKGRLRIASTYVPLNFTA